VVRATDEHALLQQVCETIAASEGIRLAWVGYVQHDEAKSVRPIAHAGINDGYTAALKISWDANSPYGYGPNGIAVRSRQPYIIRDTRDGQSEVSWQQDMVKRGYASMATFPLLNDDQVLGTLSVYSEQPDAFDSIEVELLAELAADLAYGIITQRTREERRLAQQAEREQRLLAEALRDTAAVINSSLDPDEVLDHILDHIGHVLPHNQVNIMLLENGIARAVRCRNYASPETEEWVRTTDFDIDQVAGLRLMTQTKEPYIITDNLTPDAWTAFPQTYWVRSYAGAPILLDGEVIGFLNLDSDIPGTFTENHIERLKIFANQAAIAIRNARLFAAEREQRTLAETLRDTAALLTSTLDFDEILDHILNQMGRIVPYEAVSITLVDGEVLRIVRHRGFTERGQGSYVSDLTFDATANPWFDSMQATGQPLFVADVLEDPNWITIEGLNWIRAHLGMPIRVDNKVVGILNLDSSTPGFFTPTHAHQLQILANLVAIAFRNATLFSAERQQRAFTEALHETAILINSTLDFSEVLDRILNNVSKVLTHSTANIMLLDEKDYLHPVGSHGYAERGLLEWFQNVNYPASKVPGMRYMMDTHQPVVYSDIRQHPGWALVEETRWVQSYIGAPILQENEAIGFLNLYSDTPGFFKEADAQRLQGFASQAAVAIRNSQLFMAEREQRNLAEALRDTAAALNRILNFDEVLDYILANVGQVMPHDAANIMLIEHGLARVVRGHGYEQFGVADWVKKLRFIVAEVPVWKDLIATRRPFAVSDTKSNPDWMSEDLPEERWIASTLKVPILLDNELIGILHLDSATTGAFTQKDADRLQAFADQIALAIRNARLFDQVQSYAAELEHRVLVRTAELEAQRAELKTILDSMGEGLIYSAGKRVLYVNQAYTDLLGYSSEAYHIDSDNIYQQIISAVPDYELTMRYIQRAFERRQSWRGEIRVKRADGQDIDVAITLSQVYSPSDEKARGVVVILHDISQEKALRIQKDRFIANASHELRTPLANIKTRLYLLQKQPQKLDSHLEILDRVTNNMSELIENLLDVSRFERGKIPLNRHPIQLQKLVAEVVDIQQAEAERKSVTLDAVLPAEPVYINADSRRLLQVLTNLIVNAISYTPETGQVQVELLTTPPETGHPTGLAVLQVRDTGVGIDPAQLHQVFEPFFRAHEGVSSGTGLGLTIAREITHLHDGEITVESEVGRGSTFTLKLDIHPSPDDNLQ
ncbi:MAG TPA: GAF domain-containing protein, partial [Aggregatilineaceae bacterium]|nr:GAF domain-containing protein [Aggregatilineaceae bacterium]